MLFRLGNNGNVAAAIFLAKNLLGYRDVVNNQLSGLDGGDIQSPPVRTSLNSAMKSSNFSAQLLRRPGLQNEIDRELAARSLGDFVRAGMAHHRAREPFVPGWHIDAIIEHLEATSRGQIRRSADQRSSATHEKPAGVGVLALLGMDQLAGTPLALQQLCGEPRLRHRHDHRRSNPTGTQGTTSSLAPRTGPITVGRR